MGGAERALWAQRPHVGSPRPLCLGPAGLRGPGWACGPVSPQGPLSGRLRLPGISEPSPTLFRVDFWRLEGLAWGSRPTWAPPPVGARRAHQGLFPQSPRQRQEESVGVGGSQLPGASVTPARVPTTGFQRPQSTVAVRLFPPSAGVPGGWVQHCWPGASQDAEQTCTFSKPSATVVSLRTCRGTAGVTLPMVGGTQAWGRVGGWDAGLGGPSGLVPVPGALPGLARDTGLMGELVMGLSTSTPWGPPGLLSGVQSTVLAPPQAPSFNPPSPAGPALPATCLGARGPLAAHTPPAASPQVLVQGLRRGRSTGGPSSADGEGFPASAPADTLRWGPSCPPPSVPGPVLQGF